MSRKDRDHEEKDLLDIIHKNAKRLKELTKAVSDILRTEGNSLILYK
jgi:hypothetical protein